MKSIIVIIEGLADQALEELNGCTPMERALSRVTSRIAASGRGGVVPSFAPSFKYRNEMFLAQVLGVPPDESQRLFRGPLEAEGARMEIGENDFCYRANFITLDRHTILAGQVHQLTLKETESLVASLSELEEADGIELSVIGPGRFVLVMRDAEEELPVGRPPHVMEDQDYGYFIPRHKDGKRLRRFLERAHQVLADHPINEVRTDLRENPANGIWIWGGGRRYEPQVKTVRLTGDLRVLTHSVMAGALARIMQFRQNDLENPWKLGDGERPEFPAKVLEEAFREDDTILIYLESPLEYGLYGTGAEKVRFIEILDQFMFGAIERVSRERQPGRLVLAVDGMISSRSTRQEFGELPVLLNGYGVEPDKVTHWDERSCTEGGLGLVQPGELVRLARSTL